MGNDLPCVRNDVTHALRADSFFDGAVKESINEPNTMISDSLTDERDMSKAAFATSLLSGLLISWQKDDPDMNVVADSVVGVFARQQELEKGGQAKISEHDGTLEALLWLFGKLEQALRWSEVLQWMGNRWAFPT